MTLLSSQQGYAAAGLSYDRRLGGTAIVTAWCRDCGRSGAFTSKSLLPPEVASKKLKQRGWSERGGKWTCENCNSIQKVKIMNQTKTAPVAVPPAAPQPSLKQMRSIMDALETHFDEKEGRYRNGKTDELLAEELGLPRIMVSTVREDAFGPLKVPQAFYDLQNDVTTLRTMLGDVEQRLAKAMQQFKGAA